MTQEPVRVRFAPSPTGYLHVGGARTALFNWLLARRTGGQFVLRIEDTDQSRHVEDSTAKILDDLRWLGLPWDEGPEVGGDHGPYFQSQRLDVYNRYCEQLIEAGRAYYALETPQELAAMRETALREKRPVVYHRPDPLPTPDQARAAKDAGRPVTVRFMMPGGDVVVTDEILGEVRLAGQELDDFVIQKSDGWPTYHFACVVDDALMKIDFVLRGQEHLINTPKHVALQSALGFDTPRYAHLPIIFNADGSKMSKRTAIKEFGHRLLQVRQRSADVSDEDFARNVADATGVPADTVGELLAGKHTVIDPALQAVAGHLGIDLLEINVHDFRVSGYLPEALINFISLLGWSPGEDREQMTIDETVELFDIARIGKTNARFDRGKLAAFNTDWANRTSQDRLAEAFDDYLHWGDSPMRSADAATRRHLLKVCAGFRTFKELDVKGRNLFVDDEAITYEPKAVKKNLTRNDDQGYHMLETLLPRLESCDPWTGETLEKLFEQVCAEQDIKLGNAAQPVRVAVTGTSISPPIFDTLVLLGKEQTLARIRRCLSARA
ncbi:MAG TPA: glutamate--tRNA ligase [Phycisphaerae bacterium]|nr:glutamate--tRNA ligase [Phycisphaerae bacterium]